MSEREKGGEERVDRPREKRLWLVVAAGVEMY